MDFFRFQRPIPPIGPETVFEVFGFPIANTTLYLFVIAAALFIASFIGTKKLALVPGKVQGVVESIYETLTGFIMSITKTRERADKVFPIIGAIFVFVGLANFGGLIPGIGTIQYDGVSIFRTGTADFNTTFALALGSVIVINIISIRDWGVLGHLNKFFKVKEVVAGFRQGLKPGMMAIVEFFVGLLDIIGEVAKVLSLSLRLFGNMYAGEVLMTILIGSFAFVVPSLWLAMSVLSALVQTIVFGALVTVFYMLAIKETPVKAS